MKHSLSVILLVGAFALSGCGAAGLALSAGTVALSASSEPVTNTGAATWPCEVLGICEE